MTIIIFILVLLVTVLVHEWGHFFAARKSGMLVEEFGFGIPPKLWSFKKGEVEYSVNALPIGGFVKIAGENGDEATVPRERQFGSKPWYLQALVLVAGVIMNAVLAIALFTAAYVIGMPAHDPNGAPTVISVSKGLPASNAGITSGATIERIIIDGKELKTYSTEALRAQIAAGAKKIEVTYEKNNATATALLEPNSDGMIGISIDTLTNLRLSLGEAFISACKQSLHIATEIVRVVGALIAGIFSPNGASDGLVGPVGLAREVGNAATFGFSYLLAFTALISMNLAVLNIMPFPALDGGRLIIVFIEAIIRRKLSSKVIGVIHGAGFVVLLGLMLLLTIGDIGRILR